MAREKKDNSSANKTQNARLTRNLASLRRQMTGIYKDTYSTNPDIKADLERISTNIEDRINNALDRNNPTDIADISSLYSAVKMKNSADGKIYDSVEGFFNDPQMIQQLTDSYIQNRWIEELDNEIDVVCKYMPKLTECVNCIKDSILTADNFEKDYLTFNTKDLASDDLPAFNTKITAINKKYKLDDRVDRWVTSVVKYGEQFVYRVPYKKALALLLNNRSKYPTSYRESTEIALLESGKIPRSIQGDPEVTQYMQDLSGKDSNLNIKLEICSGSILQTAVNESSKMRKALAIAEQTSVQEAYKYLDEAAKIEAETMNKELNTSIFKMPKSKKENISQDGLVNPDEAVSPDSIKVTGCLLKDLKRKNIILLYMDNICLGYYYIEFLAKDGQTELTSSIFTSNAFKTNPSYATGAKTQDLHNQNKSVDNLLKYLSYTIANNLDEKFINNNTNLKESIYAILKYNEVVNAASLDTIRVTYIAPEDMEHLMLEEDPDTHRGISRLLYSLIPAKLWACLTMADVIGMITRGQDHRVYYVKQNVEQNIAATLINVINQIKKQNFNIMQIESMNSILGIIGKYNDFVIPVSQSGDYPVQMEVMQGQDINPQTEFLEKLEELTINATGFPLEYINARDTVDFASQLTMTNTKVMRMVFKYQSKMEKNLSSIMTFIYNNEYEVNDKKEESRWITVNCILPAPVTLSINNLNQLIEIVSQQAEQLSMLEYPDENDENITIKRNIYKQKYVKYKLGTYLKQNELSLIKAQSDAEFEIHYKKSNNTSEESY